MSLIRRVVGTRTNKGEWEKTVQFKGGKSWLPKLKGPEVPLRLQHHTPVMHRRKKRVCCYTYCCFAEGVVLDVIGTYGVSGVYQTEETAVYSDTDGELFYPQCCTKKAHYIRRYNGIRYAVNVCAGERKLRIVAVPTDFTQYITGDKVLLFFSKNWEPLIEPAVDQGAECGEVNRLYIEWPLYTVGEDKVFLPYCIQSCKEKHKMAERFVQRPGKVSDAASEEEFGVTLENAPDGAFIILSRWP